MNTKELKLGQINEIAASDNGAVNTLLYLPTSYDGNKKYPVICFFHGKGEAGTDLKKQLKQGLPKVYQSHIDAGDIADTELDRFIMIAIQAPASGNYSPSPSDNVKAIDYLKSKGISIDETRIYATGLSAGGKTSADAIIDYHDVFAATIPMSKSWSAIYANAYKDRPCWLIHGTSDTTCPLSNSTNYANAINGIANGNAILTTFVGGHCCWTKFYESSWKWMKHETTKDIGEPNGMNLYEWLLQFSISEKEVPTEPAKPVQPKAVVQMGEIEDGTVILDGSGSTGTIDVWNWGKQKGPSVRTEKINGGKKLKITGLQTGGYQFYLTVESPRIGIPSSDIVRFTVTEDDLKNNEPTEPTDPPDDPTPPVTVEKIITKVIIEFSDGTTKEI